MKKLESIKKSKFTNIEAKKMQEVFGGSNSIPTEVDTVSTTASNQSEGDPTVCDLDVPSSYATR